MAAVIKFVWCFRGAKNQD